MQAGWDTRVCLKIAFRQLCVPLCGKSGPDEGGVAGYVDRSGIKYTAKWGGRTLKTDRYPPAGQIFLKIPYLQFLIMEQGCRKGSVRFPLCKGVIKMLLCACPA